MPQGFLAHHTVVWCLVNLIFTTQSQLLELCYYDYSAKCFRSLNPGHDFTFHLNCNFGAASRPSSSDYLSVLLLPQNDSSSLHHHADNPFIGQVYKRNSGCKSGLKWWNAWMKNAPVRVGCVFRVCWMWSAKVWSRAQKAAQALAHWHFGNKKQDIRGSRDLIWHGNDRIYFFAKAIRAQKICS